MWACTQHPKTRQIKVQISQSILRTAASCPWQADRTVALLLRTLHRPLPIGDTDLFAPRHCQSASRGVLGNGGAAADRAASA